MRVEMRPKTDVEVVIALDSTDCIGALTDVTSFGCNYPQGVAQTRETLYEAILEAKSKYGHVDKIVIPKMLGRLFGIEVCYE